MNAPVLWAPNPGPQTAFLESAAYEVLYGGAAGGGKSQALLFGALRQVHHPSYRALILRRTFPELRELMDVGLEFFAEIGGAWNEQQKRWRFPSGATVEFGYCTQYRDVLQYQGQHFEYIGFDELGQIAEERIWTYLMSRNRAGGPGLVMQMRASANPGGAGHHWIKRRFIDCCDPLGLPTRIGHDTRAYFRALLADNPKLTAHDPGYADRLKQLPELEYRWLGLGDWSAGGGLAFPELGDRHAYFVEPRAVPEHWTRWAAFDWGYAHPFAFGLFAADESGQVFLVDSCHGRHLQPPDIADRWKRVVDDQVFSSQRFEVYAGHDCWADIKARGEMTPTLAEQFYAEGFYLTRASISRVAGVQNLRRYFARRQGPPRFRWFDTSANRRTFDCVASRIADPDDIEDVLKQDADENGQGGDDAYDMCLAGITRIITDEGEREIRSLVGTTGTCLTPMGWRRYRAVRQTRPLEPTYVLGALGLAVRATGDHEILTLAGWQRLDAVRPGDVLVAVDPTSCPVAGGAGVSGAHILAHDARVLSASDAVALARGLRDELRADTARPSGASPGRGSREQPAREPHRVAHAGAPASALDAGTPREGTRAYPHAHDPEGEGVAPFTGGAGVASKEWRGEHGASSGAHVGVRVLSFPVHNKATPGAVLSPEPQDAVLSPGGPHLVKGHVTRAAYRSGIWEPVYNLEVEGAHCLVVNGGLVVHNCRYGLAARPITARLPKRAIEGIYSGRDPRMKELPSGHWVGPEVEEQEQYTHGAGAQLPIGHGL